MCSPAGACVRPVRTAPRFALLSRITAHIDMLLCSKAADHADHAPAARGRPRPSLPAKTHRLCAVAWRCSDPYESCPSQQPRRPIEKPKPYLLASHLSPCAAAGLCSKPC